ncbi:MAG: 23S rRNA (uracil1939-C5)-methyltransferase [Sphingobacteriales bacterium]
MNFILKRDAIVEKVTVIDTADGGRSVGKVDGLTIFIANAVPGDVVDVRIQRKKRKFYEGEAIKFHSTSPNRVSPVCQHFEFCGGCKWQHFSYEGQLIYKQQHVQEALSRIGGIPLPVLEPILGSEENYFYRNKLEFTFSSKRWLTKEEIATGDQFDGNALGFHVPRMFDKVIDIDKCHLQGGLSNDIRNEVRRFSKENNLTHYDIRNHHGLFRNLIVRTTTTGELMVIVAFGESQPKNIELVMEFIKERFSEISSLMYVVNEKKNDTLYDQDIKLYDGKDHIIERMQAPKEGFDSLDFKIGPKTFYQTNPKQAERLYKVAFDFADFKETDVVYDLYTGAGTIACYVSPHVGRVVGVEYVESAVADARVNATMNKLENTYFEAGDMKDVFTDEFIQKNGKPDVVITDPPRAGMHTDVVETLLRLAAPKIVYISCNPSTQARDLEVLGRKYNVERVRPVDMFPHTDHVENVVLLTLK